jgi:hypothetical protein
MDERLTPSNIYELVAEVGFKKYFHLGGFAATRALIDLCPINENSRVIDIGILVVLQERRHATWPESIIATSSESIFCPVWLSGQRSGQERKG